MRAHHTGELLPCIIWWTGQPRTMGFHMRDESTIGISNIKSRHKLGIFVHTFICGTIKTMVCRHQVSSVLCGPVCGAVDFSWNHQQCSSCCDITHCTRNIVVINISQWLERPSPILYSIYIASFLCPTLILQVVRIIWQAEIVGTSSFVIPITPSSPPRVRQLSSLVTGTNSPPPANIGSSSYGWSW